MNEEKELIKCPKCRKSYYIETAKHRTSYHYPPIMKNGVNINPDANSTKTTCVCKECGNKFMIVERLGEIEVISRDDD